MNARSFRRRLLRWYRDHGRQLPWRASADPYRIWLSEVMLQQTTVAAVVPYFRKFTIAFPDVQSLAAADLDNVLRHWEGLGYYSRARNLHRAAQMIVSQHDGRFPEDVATLQTLPGIGRYTAGAIVSFAFGRRAPILEANTERLYARLSGMLMDVGSNEGKKSLWAFADTLVSDVRPGDLNQALMDLGADICRPENPDCGSCPVSADCVAFLQGTQAVIPVRKPRVAVTPITECAIVLRVKNSFLLRRRAPGERWAGLWDFPRYQLTDEEAGQLSPLVRENLRMQKHLRSPVAQTRQRSLFAESVFHQSLPEFLISRFAGETSLEPDTVIRSVELQYSVTRYRVKLLCFVCEGDRVNRQDLPTKGEWQWCGKKRLAEIPLSITGRRIADWL